MAAFERGVSDFLAGEDPPELAPEEPLPPPRDWGTKKEPSDMGSLIHLSMPQLPGWKPRQHSLCLCRGLRCGYSLPWELAPLLLPEAVLMLRKLCEMLCGDTLLCCPESG